MRCYILGMRKITLIIAAVSLLGLSQAGDAQACTCRPSPPPTTALGESDAVFAGRVVEVSRGEDPMAALTAPMAALTAKFAVSTVWKGEVGETVEVRTPLNSAACGVGFEAGEEWLVYANEQEGVLNATLCSRTSPLRAATEDLAALGPGSEPGGGRPPTTPPRAGSCACAVIAAEGDGSWGAFAALGLAGVLGARVRQRRR